MTIQKIKENIKSILGKRVEIIYNGSRNKVESYIGVIKEIYDYIFIVEVDDNLKKSFSYVDVLIGVVNIK
jgi:uncharacterized protein Veg